jgi:hypothetical protein
MDAKVFGYLALQLYPELPDPHFQKMLQDDFPRLVAFCDRCKDEFFANLPEKTDPTESSPFFTNPFSAPKEWFKNTFLTASTSSPSSTSTNGNGAASDKEGGKKSQEERDFDLKRIYAITFGTLAMVTYVIVNGLVVIGNEEEEEEEEVHQPISFGY